MTTQPEALRLAEVSPYLEGQERGQWIMDAAAELRRLHTLNAKLVEAYRKMYNAAAGYSNYCEDSASVRRCERDFEEADAIFRAAIAKAEAL